MDIMDRLAKLEDEFHNHDRHPIGGALVDYSSTSTVTGWSSTTTKEIYYYRLGKLVFVFFTIEGTSDATAASFTVPFTNGAATERSNIRAVDNGGTAVISIAQIAASAATVSMFPTAAGGNWTASGTKGVRGQLFYVMA